MQLILKPTSHPETGEIIINDSLFAIGRHEAPFDVCEPGLVDKMSKRHARIFEQDSQVYIADLDSLNGTTVNGRTVRRAPLRAGDVVGFGDLQFDVRRTWWPTGGTWTGLGLGALVVAVYLVVRIGLARGPDDPLGDEVADPQRG